MSDDEREYRRRDKFFTERRGQLRYVVCELQPFIFDFFCLLVCSFVSNKRQNS